MVEHETEGVTGRIDVDPEVLPTGLRARLGRADGEHCLLTGIEISDIEIDVQLLGMIIARPVRRSMTGANWKAIVAPCGLTSCTQSSSASGSPRICQPVTAA